MKLYAKDIDSKKHWDKIASQYDEEMKNAYHAARLKMIKKLYQDFDFQNKHCLDFGCGNGVTVFEFLEQGANCLGFDVSKEMITMAKQGLKKRGLDESLVRVGGVNALSPLSSESFDLITSFNVLAYLDDAEILEFYRQAHRLLKTGGQLVVTHSNELFDMYSLNSYTVEFFAKHFYDGDRRAIGKLLKNGKNPEIITYNVRVNPLNYKYTLKEYGFTEVQQEFYNLHTRAPSLLKQKEYPDTLNYFDKDKWKLMFMCSAFGSRSVKT